MRTTLVVCLLVSGLAQAEESDPDDAIRNDPKRVTYVSSAAICAMRALRSTVIDEIATERRYGSVGGFVNKRKLYNLQRQLRHADEEVARFRDGLKAKKLKPLACTEGHVRALLVCRYEPKTEGCESEIVQRELSFIPDDAPDAE